jgi:hypothetical protein
VVLPDPDGADTMYRFPRIPLKTLSLAQGQQEPREMAIKMQKKRAPR